MNSCNENEGLLPVALFLFIDNWPFYSSKTFLNSG